MTKSKILLTSFQPWLPHHQSNSSDDLLELCQALNLPEKELFFLRQLPVKIEEAWALTQTKIQELNPDVVICCGMAEKSSVLALESQACYEDQVYHTRFNLTDLIKDLSITEISNDAGKFVCEGLYFQVLQYLQSFEKIKALFIHVPLLNSDNQSSIFRDFHTILSKLK